MSKRQLHPKLAAHAQKVKAAHAHLAKTQPGFNQMPAKQRFAQVQAHIRRQG